MLSENAELVVLSTWKEKWKESTGSRVANSYSDTYRRCPRSRVWRWDRTKRYRVISLAVSAHPLFPVSLTNRGSTVVMQRKAGKCQPITTGRIPSTILARSRKKRHTTTRYIEKTFHLHETILSSLPPLFSFPFSLFRARKQGRKLIDMTWEIVFFLFSSELCVFLFSHLFLLNWTDTLVWYFAWNFTRISERSLRP